MSDERQRVRKDEPEYVSARTELFMYVERPKDWMFDVLIGLGGMPFDEQVSLHWWHTVPNGMPMTAEPSLLTDFLFLPPYLERDDFNTLRVDGEKVDMLWLVPITHAELRFALKHSSGELDDRFRKSSVDPVVRENRKSIV